MPILVLLLMAVLVILLFGPLIAVLAAIGGVVGLAGWGLLLLVPPILTAAFGLLALFVWGIWWCFDRDGASEAWFLAGRDDDRLAGFRASQKQLQQSQKRRR